MSHRQMFISLIPAVINIHDIHKNKNQYIHVNNLFSFIPSLIEPKYFILSNTTGPSNLRNPTGVINKLLHHLTKPNLATKCCVNKLIQDENPNLKFDASLKAKQQKYSNSNLFIYFIQLLLPLIMWRIQFNTWFARSLLKAHMSPSPR